MKKILLFLLTFSLIPSQAFAAGSTLTISSAHTAKVGQSVNLTVGINPQGEEIDTIRAYITYPPDLVSIDRVTNGGTFPNPSPGNTLGNGQISWGGFRTNGPSSESSAFITIKAVMLKAGTATFSVLGSSRIISAGEEKGSGAYGSTTITIGDSAEAPSVSKPAAPSINPTQATISCPSHPDENHWYKERLLNCAAENLEGKMEIEIKQGENSVWKTTLTKSVPSFSVLLEDGDYELFVNTAQKRGILIDSTAPKAFFPTIERLSFGEQISVYFGTTDNLSGIDHYSIVSTEKTEDIPQSTIVLSPNSNYSSFTILAWDKAGNSTPAAVAVYSREIISWTYWISLIISLFLWIYLLGHLHGKKHEHGIKKTRKKES